MKFDANVNIHNEFTIEVRDAKTGELKQQAKAYNIVLNALFSRLVNRQSFFDYIFFGTGTGTLDATRTSMFSRLGYKAAVDHDSSRAYPTSYRTRKCVLAPEEYLGETITEVGIAYGTSTTYLVTHAMLQDAAGNPISITKAADGTDIITIYAKMYFELGAIDGMYGGKVRWVPATRNRLLGYLLGDLFPGVAFRVGASRHPNAIGQLGATANIAWTADAPNKKMTTNLARLDVNTGNGSIKTVWLGGSDETGIFQAILPVTGVLESRSITDKRIAIGDGVTTEFALPWDDATAVSAVRVDGAVVTPDAVNLKRSSKGYRALVPSEYPAAVSYGAAWSPNEKYLAVAHDISPYLTLFATDSGSLTKLPSNFTLPTGTGRGVAWSPDGAYLAVAHDASPYVSVYSNDNGTLTKLPDPLSLPTGTGVSVSWSSDGAYLAIAHYNSPYVTVYSHNSGTLTKLADPDVLPPFIGLCAAWSPDGNYLAIAHDTSPYITLYSHSNGLLTKQPDPAVLPTGMGRSVTWSPDGAYLAVAHFNSPYVTLYSHSNGTLTKLSDPNTTPTGNAIGAAWSPDGLALAVAHNTSPFITVYSNVSGSLKKIADPDALPSAHCLGVVWTASGDYLAVTHGTSQPYLVIYAGFRGGPSYNVKLPSALAQGAILTGDWTIDYVPKDIDHVFDMQAAITFGTPS